MRKLIPRLIPVLLLQKSGLYKTRKFREPQYVGDPINAVRIFNEKEVDELVFLDIEAPRKGGEPNFGALADISCECFMPLCYGGGVSSLKHIEQILKLGVEKVAINSALFESPDFVREAANEFGSSTIVASIDYKHTMFRGNVVFIKGGKVSTKRGLDEYLRYAEDLGVGEILLNSIDRDGTKSGYDHTTLSVSAEGRGVPLVACGGASSIEDMKSAVDESGASAAAAGAYFVFVGKHRAVLINYPSQEEIRETFASE